MHHICVENSYYIFWDILLTLISILCGLLTIWTVTDLGFKNSNLKKINWNSHQARMNFTLAMWELTEVIACSIYVKLTHFRVFFRIWKNHIHCPFNTPGSQYSQWGWMAWRNISASSTVSTPFVFGFIRIQLLNYSKTFQRKWIRSPGCKF